MYASFLLIGPCINSFTNSNQRAKPTWESLGGQKNLSLSENNVNMHWIIK